MKKEGLLTIPDFSNVEKYLQAGKRTEITDRIRAVADLINGQTDGILIRNILLWMNQNTERLQNGNSNWVLIDSDQPVQDIRDVRFDKLDLNNRNIRRGFYALAYVNDYSNVEYNGMRIDSIDNMNKIQTWHIKIVIKVILVVWKKEEDSRKI